MGRHLFLTIYEDITDAVRGCEIFLVGRNAAGMPTPLMKLVVVFRQLVYDILTHLAEEGCGCPKDTARLALVQFCKWVEIRYASEFIVEWKEEDLEHEFKINEERGFLGILGSIDCTHWGWRNCPHVWKDMF